MVNITRTSTTRVSLAPGKALGKTSIHAILINESYTGTLVWGTNSKDNAEPVRVEKAFPRHRHQGPVQPRQQADALSRTQEVPSPKGRKHLSAQRLVKCKTCNRALSGQDAKSGQFAYYVCQSIMKRGKDACDTPRLNARRFEELVVDKIRSNILTEGSITDW